MTERDGLADGKARMLKSPSRRVLGVAVTVGAVVWLGSSCPETRVPTEATTTLTNATFAISSTADAIARIAARRCEREVVCLERAHDGASDDACTRRMQTAFAIELDPATACPHGVLRIPLEACLAAIGDERCMSSRAMPASLTACRTSTLCPGEGSAR